MTNDQLAAKHNALVLFLRQQAREQAIRLADQADDLAALRQRLSVLEAAVADLV